MLLNLSNHPLIDWQPDQREAASVFGAIEDVRFPRVPPEVDAAAIAAMADDWAERVQARLNEGGAGAHAALVVGEATLTAALVARLQSAGVRCIAATTERDVVHEGDGARRIVFRFVRFRDYPPLCP